MSFGHNPYGNNINNGLSMNYSAFPGQGGPPLPPVYDHLSVGHHRIQTPGLGNNFNATTLPHPQPRMPLYQDPLTVASSYGPGGYTDRHREEQTPLYSYAYDQMVNPTVAPPEINYSSPYPTGLLSPTILAQRSPGAAFSVSQTLHQHGQSLTSTPALQVQSMAHPPSLELMSHSTASPISVGPCLTPAIPLSPTTQALPPPPSLTYKGQKMQAENKNTISDIAERLNKEPTKSGSTPSPVKEIKEAESSVIEFDSESRNESELQKTVTETTNTSSVVTTQQNVTPVKIAKKAPVTPKTNAMESLVIITPESKSMWNYSTTSGGKAVCYKMKPPEKMEPTDIIHSTPDEEYNHNQGKYNCLKCNYHSPRLDKILQHIHAHKGKLICKTCGKAFIKTCDLVRHNHAHAMGRVRPESEPGQNRPMSEFVARGEELDHDMDLDDMEDAGEEKRLYKNVLSTGAFQEDDKTQEDDEDEKNKEKTLLKTPDDNTNRSPGQDEEDTEDDFSCVVVDTETGVSIDVLKKDGKEQKEQTADGKETESVVDLSDDKSDDDVAENGANISGPIVETENMDASPTTSNVEQATDSFSIASGPVPNLAHLAQSGMELEAIGMDSEEFVDIARGPLNPGSNSKEEAFFSSNHKGNYACGMCSYVTSNPRLLTRHLRAHTRSNKVCRFCSKAFERPSDLVRHEERHNLKFKSQGVNPLTRGKLVLKHCSKCKFATLDAGVLYQHARRVHGAPMKYKCNICHKKFTSVMSIKNHQKFMHSIHDGKRYTEVLVIDDGLPTGVPGREKNHEAIAFENILESTFHSYKPQSAPKIRKRLKKSYQNRSSVIQERKVPFEMQPRSVPFLDVKPNFLRVDQYERNVLTNTGLLEIQETGDNEFRIVTEAEKLKGDEDIPFVCTLPQAKYVATVTARGCGGTYRANLTNEYRGSVKASNIRVLVFKDEFEEQEYEPEPEKRIRPLLAEKRLKKQKNLNSSWPLPSTGPGTLDSKNMHVKETEVLPNMELSVKKPVASPLLGLPQTSKARPIPQLTTQPLVNITDPNVSQQKHPILNKVFSSPIMTIPGSEQSPMMNQIKSEISESSAGDYLTGVRSHKTGYYGCTECSYSTAQAHKMEQHKKAHYLGKHICKICKKAFIKTSDLTRHWICHRSVFQKGVYHCDTCAFTSPSQNEIENHMKMHYMAKGWGVQSKEIQQPTKSPNQHSPEKVAIHQQQPPIHRTDPTVFHGAKGPPMVPNTPQVAVSGSKASQGKFVCKVCRSTFISPGALERHQVIDHIMADRLQGSDTDTLSCLFCSKIYNDPFRLYKHEQFHRSRKHRVMPYQLAPTINSRRTVQQQLAPTINSRRTVQQQLAPTVNSRRTVQQIQSNYCYYCCKGFPSKTVYDDHMNIHTGDKPHSCPLCGESYAMRTYLDTHIANGCHGHQPMVS